jgi:hypothetical protein
MMKAKQDPAYKRLCRVFEESGLSHCFANYQGQLNNAVHDAYDRAMGTNTIWQGDWHGNKFHKYVAKCALDEFLAQQFYTSNPLLTKKIVGNPGRNIVTLKENNLYVGDKLLATFGKKEINITPVWLQEDKEPLESQCT